MAHRVAAPIRRSALEEIRDGLDALSGSGSRAAAKKRQALGEEGSFVEGGAYSLRSFWARKSGPVKGSSPVSIS